MTHPAVVVLFALALLTSPIAVSAQPPRPGGVFRIGVPDPPALDPHQVVNFLPQTVVSLAYGHLLRFPAGPEQTSSTDFRILPDLAEKWEYQNPTTLVFSLRRGVRFHKKPPMNGREVVADDVNDAELNKLLLAQRREMDSKKRREIVYEIQRYLADKAYYVGVPMYPRYISHPPYVKGFKHHDGYDLGRRLTFTWIDRSP